jgi:hypothetical protein
MARHRSHDAAVEDFASLRAVCGRRGSNGWKGMVQNMAASMTSWKGRDSKKLPGVVTVKEAELVPAQPAVPLAAARKSGPESPVVTVFYPVASAKADSAEAADGVTHGVIHVKCKIQVEGRNSFRVCMDEGDFEQLYPPHSTQGEEEITPVVPSSEGEDVQDGEVEVEMDVDVDAKYASMSYATWWYQCLYLLCMRCKQFLCSCCR